MKNQPPRKKPGNRQPQRQVVVKKTTTTPVPTPKKSRKKLLWIVLGLIVSAFILMQYNKTSRVPPVKEAQLILKRALEISDSVTPQNNIRGAIKEALSNIQIISANSNGQARLDSGKFFILIMPAKKMPGYELDKKDSNFTLMSYNWEAFAKGGKVVVMMSENVDTISRDIDAKATDLIHELLHGIQTAFWLQQGVKMEDIFNNKERYYNDERDAWNIQLDLYKKIHPEYFTGAVTCDCRIKKIFGPENIRNDDRMQQSLLLYYFCGESFLKELYNIK